MLHDKLFGGEADEAEGGPRSHPLNSGAPGEAGKKPRRKTADKVLGAVMVSGCAGVCVCVWGGGGECDDYTSFQQLLLGRHHE